MSSRKFVMRFPVRLIDTPIATRLVSEHGLVINILRAHVEPNEEGMLVVELTGEPAKIEGGLAFVRGLGVEVEPLSKGVTFREEMCVECTACRSVCPTGALSVKTPEMTVTFDKEKCIACELCIPACPYRAVEAAI